MVKKHFHVVRDIESLDIPQEFAKSNFGLSEYKAGNRAYKMHEVTRDGFTLLAMGFTGKKAMEFKLGYIMAFNKMETELLKKYEQPAISSTISPEQQRIIQEKVATLAVENKAYAKYYGAIKTHFKIAKYDQLPVTKLEEALELLEGVVIEPKSIESELTSIPHMAVKHPELAHQRYMISYDHEGTQHIKPIDKDACVMTAPEMLKAMHAPNGMIVSTESFADFAIETIKTLKKRVDYYQSKTQH